MKVIRIVLIALISIVGIYLVLCIFGPKTFETSRSRMIGANSETIFKLVSNFNEGTKWSPWQKKDPNMKLIIDGEPATVGHKMSWQSETQGSGQQAIMEIVPNVSVKTSLQINGWDGMSTAMFNLEPKGDSTMLTWSMDGGNLPFMFRGVMLLMGANNSLNTDYEAGLASIKSIAESMPKQVQLSIEEITLSDQWYVGKRAVLPVTQLDSSYFSAIYGALVPALADKIAGMPTSISHSYNAEKREIDIEVALPVASETKLEGYSSTMIPGGKAVKYVFVGPYEGTEKAWGQLMAQVNAKYKVRYSPYEVYANDPEEVKDPSKYITWMIVPVE
jgi:effector-binding domain-containing protein